MCGLLINGDAAPRTGIILKDNEQLHSLPVGSAVSSHTEDNGHLHNLPVGSTCSSMLRSTNKGLAMCRVKFVVPSHRMRNERM